MFDEWIVFKKNSWNSERSCQIFQSQDEAIAAMKADWKETAAADTGRMTVDHDQSYETSDYAILYYSTGDRIEWYCEPATVL